MTDEDTTLAKTTCEKLQCLEKPWRRLIEVKKESDPEFYGTSIAGSFPFVPHYVMQPPVTEHVPLHSKSLLNYSTCVQGC